MIKYSYFIETVILKYIFKHNSKNTLKLKRNFLKSL